MNKRNMKKMPVILFSILLITSVIALVPTASASVSNYQIVSVAQTGANEITVVIGGRYCSACNPNSAGNPGCPAFQTTHGWNPSATSSYYYSHGGMVDGRYAAAMIEYGSGPTRVSQKFVCTPANWPLNTFYTHTFVFTGVPISGGDTIKVYGELTCSWCAHWYAAPQTLTVMYGPAADADGPYSGFENVAVALDGSGSYHTDPGGTHYITTYEWDLDNDGQYDDATGVSPSYTWTTAGTYTIGLRVTDDQSLTDTDTATVTILANRPPVADAGPDQTVEQTSYAGADVTLDGSGSYDPDGDPLTYDWTWTGGLTTGINPTVTFPLGTTTVTLTVSDGQYYDTDTVDITVVDTTPPDITCPADVTVEQESHEGTVVPLTATATDICDPAPIITSNELPIYPLGTTIVTFTATDLSGNSASCSTTVTVVDTTPPEITLAGDQIVLWPPNHKYHTIKIEDFVTSVTDICDANVGIDDIVITSVSSDEPENAQGKGDGNTVDDIVIVDSQTVKLRAERQGSGNGRVYTINFEVTDASGNTATGSCEVWVPHDQGSGSTAINDGAAAGYTVYYP